MAADLSSGAKCVKYTLFLFNILFLLAGLALIIVGAIVQVQATKSGLGSGASGAGVFIIVIGSVVFIVAFFGCAGAIYNNYCMITTYGVFLLILLLVEIAAIIAGFVLKNKAQNLVYQSMEDLIIEYTANNTDVLATKYWDSWQKDMKCCGTTNYTSWEANPAYADHTKIPSSCCKNNQTCSTPFTPDQVYEKGCTSQLIDYVRGNLIAVGATAAAVAVLEVLGIVFAFCLAHCLRKEYRVVNQ